MAETRITGGEFRGRVIATPKGMPLRPTRSMVREALFNILAAEIGGARVVDLYAGVGSVGFEALSRGAASAVFVERNARHRALIAATAERFGCADRTQVVGADVIAWLRGGGAAVAAAADLVYVDAPYRDPSLDVCLELLGSSPPALVVCEHHRERRLPAELGGLRQVREADYGLNRLTFWRREEGN